MQKTPRDGLGPTEAARASEWLLRRRRRLWLLSLLRLCLRWWCRHRLCCLLLRWLSLRWLCRGCRWLLLCLLLLLCRPANDSHASPVHALFRPAERQKDPAQASAEFLQILFLISHSPALLQQRCT
jgi:hypothetical protein